jgi:GTPase
VVVSDMVGFIRRLPDRLLASFESTLAEAREASLLALVVDVADPELRLRLETTERLLERLGAERIPRFYVFNQADRLASAPENALLGELSHGHEHALLSGHDPEAVARLRAALIRSVRGPQRPVRLFVPYDDAEAMAAVYRRCRVLHAEPRERGMRFTVAADPRVIAELAQTKTEVQP